jgi:serine/threonine protein kinase
MWTCRTKSLSSIRFSAAFSYYQQGRRECYLITEWADGGNLREFWQMNRRPTLNISLIKASIRQLHGLATALLAAHYPKDSGRSYTHGDLKPESIFWFCGTDLVGTLKIGAWGQARIIMAQSVTSRSEPGTSSYEAPETANLLIIDHSDQTRTRRYHSTDIWSMGCIIFEFMIWLLYGADGLEEFNNQLPVGSSFYEIVGNRTDPSSDVRSAVINVVVVHWLDYMGTEPICRPDSALGRLLKLVRTGLLVVKLPQRTSMTDERETILVGASREDFASLDLPSIVISQNDPVDPREESSPALRFKEDSEHVRLTAHEFERRIEGILSQDAATDEYWLPDATRYHAPTREFFDKKEHQQDTENLVEHEPVVPPIERDFIVPRPERVSCSFARPST